MKDYYCNFECTSSVDHCVGYRCVYKNDDGFYVCPNLRISSEGKIKL